MARLMRLGHSRLRIPKQSNRKDNLHLTQLNHAFYFLYCPRQNHCSNPPDPKTFQAQFLHKDFCVCRCQQRVVCSSLRGFGLHGTNSAKLKTPSEGELGASFLLRFETVV